MSDSTRHCIKFAYKFTCFISYNFLSFLPVKSTPKMSGRMRTQYCRFWFACRLALGRIAALPRWGEHLNCWKSQIARNHSGKSWFLRKALGHTRSLHVFSSLPFCLRVTKCYEPCPFASWFVPGQCICFKDDTGVVRIHHLCTWQACISRVRGAPFAVDGRAFAAFLMDLGDGKPPQSSPEMFERHPGDRHQLRIIKRRMDFSLTHCSFGLVDLALLRF